MAEDDGVRGALNLVGEVAFPSPSSIFFYLLFVPPPISLATVSVNFSLSNLKLCVNCFVVIPMPVSSVLIMT